MSVRALAIMWARNEADMLAWSLYHLVEQGIDVLLIENHSDDETLNEALCNAWNENYHNRGRGIAVRVERCPLERPETVSWAAMLRHTAEVALIEKRRGYDWILHHDADEIRRSAMPGERLIDAIARLDAAGYTAIDHDVEVYKMREEPWDYLSVDPQTWFTERHERHIDMTNGQIKAWKQPVDAVVDLAGTAGHSVQFEGRVVAPEKFRLLHFPLRTPEQAARKIAARERWDAKELAAGWHLPQSERVKA